MFSSIGSTETFKRRTIAQTDNNDGQNEIRSKFAYWVDFTFKRRTAQFIGKTTRLTARCGVA